ncbi:Gamma-glutamyltranspeptidase [Cordyceps fumosorosea ARSEF 2679]|uniref:Glutathione hydrolase n=1 Tax=Cordyceps fumosorosea (strain ARSEF 2679) TaxID=1081104 RepID=A0A167M884_CORFA|nr:Gamma-glutamyltranspeptidase [Cordyceps fumosorosea ARSEF 2679]OAA54054.1 Gamma-glutamyltranspeptidase [Cordyceps fumosorosea ARSEF 2679]
MSPLRYETKILTQRHLARLLALSLGTAAAVNAAAVPEVVFSPNGDSFGSRGAVASEASECSAIGRDIIAAGGNAVDAIVGTTFCVGVVGMYHSGIGGGGFALVRDAAGNYEAVDFRETAPAAAYEDMYADDEQLSVAGGLAVGVPGEVLGLEYIHQKYGILKWRDIMQGAIRVARHGFRVSDDMVVKMNATIKDGKTYLLDDPIFAAEFAPHGQLLRKGEVMTRKNLANTLERIANEGSDAFYHGEIAENLSRFVQSRNGTLTVADLASYTVTERPVRTIRYRGLDVYGMSAPAGGAVALQVLRVLERYPAAAAGFLDARNRSLTVHRLAEVSRFAFARRASLGDPEFVDERDVLAYERDLLADSTIDAIFAAIDDDRTKHPRQYFPSEEEVVALPESHGTSHISAADASGMAVSLTTTININFGAQIMEPNSGIILNDEMNDFSIPGVSNEFGFAPSRANFIRPRKRPLSSMTPLIAALPDGGPLYAVIGAAGGSRIGTATAQCLWHVVEHGMALREALAVGRVHDQLVPNRVTLEEAFPDWEATAADLRARGHEVRKVAPGLSSVQAIRRLEDGSFEAVGEPRQANSAGYSI